MNLVLAQALQYVKRGFSVIPLPPKSKVPDFRWKEYQDRLPTTQELEEWFGGRNGGRNIAIVTGAVSKLVVVDFDGPEGLDQMKKMGLRSGMVSVTGNGKHMFFRHPGGDVKNAVKKYPGTDIRADGGYVVVYPSIHPSGARYAWSGLFSGLSLGVLPVEVYQEKGPGTEGNSSGWVTAALEDMQVGNIDNTLFKICSRLRRDGYSKEEAFALLAPHAALAGATADHLPAKIDHVWGSYKPKEAVTPPTSLAEFMDNKESNEWIVPGVVAKNSIGFIAGLPETCKTWLTMDLAIEAARGGKWCGVFQTNKTRVLFIDQERFAGETRRRFRALFTGKKVNYKDLEGQLTIQCDTSTKLDLDSSYEAFRKVLREVQPELIIIDSFATFHTKEENNRADIQTVIERIKVVRKEFGCTILFIDHENKGVFHAASEGNEEPSAMRMAGSIAKPAAAEVIFTVRSKGKNTSGVYMTKSTLSPTIQPFFVEVKDLVEDRSSISVEGRLV